MTDPLSQGERTSHNGRSVTRVDAGYLADAILELKACAEGGEFSLMAHNAIALLAEREELLAQIRASHEMLRDKTEEGAGEPPRLFCKCRFCLVGDSHG